MTGQFSTRARLLLGALALGAVFGTMAPAQGVDLGALQSAAATGDVAAQRQLGETLVYGGEGVTQNVAEGIKQLDAAAKAGDVQAEASLGKILLDGYYLPAQPARARALLDAAAKSGNPQAQLTLGKALLWGLNLKPDLPRAKTLLQASAKAGNVEARRVLGEQLVGGWVLKRDTNEGVTLLEQAVAAGDDKAMVALGGFLLDSTALKPDHARAKALFDQAAEAGNPAGLERYGAYLMWRHRNPAEAEALLRRAGEMGRGSAWAVLAEGAMYGYLGAGSRAKFAGYAQKARAAGDPMVAVYEAERQMWGISMRARGPKTIARLEKAADAGNADAAAYLIALVRSGNHYNVRKRPDQARAYLERYAKLLGPEKTAQLAFTIDAATHRQLAAYPRLAAVYDSHPEWHSVWLGKQLLTANENLAYYLLQSKLKQEGLYAGRIDGYANQPTLRALWKACMALPNTTRCHDSIMHPNVIGEVLAR